MWNHSSVTTTTSFIFQFVYILWTSTLYVGHVQVHRRKCNLHWREKILSPFVFIYIRRFCRCSIDWEVRCNFWRQSFFKNASMTFHICPPIIYFPNLIVRHLSEDKGRISNSLCTFFHPSDIFNVFPFEPGMHNYNKSSGSGSGEEGKGEWKQTC